MPSFLENEPKDEFDEEVDGLEPEVPTLPPELESELSWELKDVEPEVEEQDGEVNDRT